MPTVFRLDGTVRSANLVWDSATNRNYLLRNEGWAPAIPELNRSMLGGRGRYETVVEERVIDVCGASVGECLANLETLALLMEQAERWSNEEEGVNPVLLSYAANAGDTTMQAAILGRADGDETRLSLPVTYNEDMRGYHIQGVRLRYRRTVFIEIAHPLQNMLRNWSFEDGEPAEVYGGVLLQNHAKGWTLSGAPTIAVNLTATFTPPHGKRHIQITNGGGVDGVYQDITGLTVGATVCLSAYVYGGGVMATIRLSDGGGFVNPVEASTNAAAWTRIFITKVVPASGSVRAFLWVNGPGACLFDAALLHYGTGPLAIEDIDTDLSRTVQISREPMVCTVADHPLASPVQLQIELRTSADAAFANNLTMHPSVLIVADERLRTRVMPGDIWSAGPAQWTIPAPAGADQPYSTQLLRYTPTGTTEVRATDVNDVGSFGTHYIAATYTRKNVRVLALAVVRASVANQFTLRGYLTASYTGAGAIEIASEPAIITTTATTIVPLIWPAPMRTLIQNAARFQISAQSTAAAGTLDIERIVFVDVTDSANLHIISLPETLQTGILFNTNARYDVRLDSIPTSRARPFLGIYSPNGSTVGAEHAIAYLGVPDVMLRGSVVSAFWLAYGNAGAATPGTYWQYYDSVSAALVYARMTATRRRALLTPRG